MKVLIISFLILLVDQISKFYIKGFYLPFFDFEHSGFPQSRSIPVIDKLFYITPVENPGIAFGIDFGPEFKTIVSVITIIATLALVIYFFSINNNSVLKLWTSIECNHSNCFIIWVWIPSSIIISFNIVSYKF